MDFEEDDEILLSSDTDMEADEKPRKNITGLPIDVLKVQK